MKTTNHLNGMRVIVRTKEAIYLRIPDQLQVLSAFGQCSCGHCDGSGKWDTVVIGTDPKDEWCTVHMPDKAIEPFKAHMKRRGLL